MTAALELQEALVTRLSAWTELSGVFDDAPARASYPYVVINCVAETPWTCRGMAGVEAVFELSLWDEQPARLMALDGVLAAAADPLPLLPTWHVSSLVVTGLKRTRGAAAPWASTLTLRVRIIPPTSEGPVE